MTYSMHFRCIYTPTNVAFIPFKRRIPLDSVKLRRTTWLQEMECTFFGRCARSNWLSSVHDKIEANNVISIILIFCSSFLLIFILFDECVWNKSAFCLIANIYVLDWIVVGISWFFFSSLSSAFWSDRLAVWISFMNIHLTIQVDWCCLFRLLIVSNCHFFLLSFELKDDNKNCSIVFFFRFVSKLSRMNGPLHENSIKLLMMIHNDNECLRRRKLNHLNFAWKIAAVETGKDHYFKIICRN